MPIRSYRVFLSNNTDFDLIKTDSHLCGGEWTSDEWTPPASIPARTQKGWQSESDGIATGTEGWVKYRLALPDLVIPGGTPPPPKLGDEVYVYWDNPFLGSPFIKRSATLTRSAVTLSGTKPDCDAPDTSTGGSDFGDSPSKYETRATSTEQDDPTIAVPGDIDGSVGDRYWFEWPIAPIVFAGKFNVVPHAANTWILRAIGSVRDSLEIGDDPTKGFRRFQQTGEALSLRALLRM
jgi:hypothetical protein